MYKRKTKRSVSVDDKSSQLSKKQAVTPTTSTQKKSYFVDVLSSCGFIFQDDDKCNILECDQAVFVYKLQNKLSQHPSYPRNLKEFMASLESYLNEESVLKKALSNTETTQQCETARGNVQASLIQMLLSVDCIQPNIMKFLFEKLLEFSFSVSNDIDGQDFPWIRVILRQMRFLDNIVDPKLLSEQLGEILDAGSTVVQREVAFCLPDIVCDEQHDEVAQKLSTLVIEKAELTPVILDALSCLTVDSIIKKEVAEQVLASLRTAPMEYFPNIVKFLLTDATAAELPQIISGLRSGLDFTPLHGDSESVESAKVLTMAAVRDVMLIANSVADAWLKEIESVVDPLPIDVVVLIIIHATLPLRRKHVEARFRAKIKAEIYNESLLEKIFSSMTTVLKNYHDSLLAIASVVLQAPDTTISCHAAHWFKLLLLHFEGHYAQSTLLKLMALTCGDYAGNMHAGLNVLSTLSRECAACLIPNRLLLLNLIHKLSKFDLGQVELVMDVLCQISYNQQQTGSDLFRDEIHMVICKKVSSSNLLEKKKGVIGAVMAAKAIVSRNSTDSQSSVDSSNDLTQETMKGAIELMDLVMAGTKTYPEAQGLFFDEMSLIAAKTPNLGESFISWINDKLLNDFEEQYIADVSDLKLEKGLSIKFEENNGESEICIPLAHMLNKKQEDVLGKRKHPSLVIFNSFFRLLRLVKMLTSDGVLDEIDALLVCGVVMPECEDEADFRFMEPDQKQLVLDSLFYCINWFRELINAFVFQKSVLLQEKVLARLHTVLDLENQLAVLLPRAADGYEPPPCHFYADPIPLRNQRKTDRKKSGKKPGKKSKSAKKTAEVAEEDEDPDEAVSAAAPAPALPGSLPTDIRRSYLRELDVDVLVLLCRPLDSVETSSKESLDVKTLLFLLEDYVAKLEYLYGTGRSRGFKIGDSAAASSSLPLGFANACRHSPQEFLPSALKVQRKLCQKLEIFASYFQKLLAASDGVMDAPKMFEDGSLERKRCFSLIIEAMSVFFSWQGFNSPANLEHFKAALHVFASRASTDKKELTSVDELVRASFKYLRSYVKCTVQLSAACSLVTLLERISNFAASSKPALQKQLAERCHSFLSRQWFTETGAAESGMPCRRGVRVLINCYVSCSPDKLRLLCDILPQLREEIEQRPTTASTWSMTMFPIVNKSSFSVLFAQMFRCLLEGTEEAFSDNPSSERQFKVWRVVTDLLPQFEAIVKAHSSGTLVAVIKSSQQLLKLFLQRGVRIMDALLREKREEVISLLKDLQKYNRFLHNLCFHTKEEKNLAVTKFVPRLRLTLEQLRVQVKSIMAANGCIGAFTAGNLRNRNLQGEIVPSQSTVAEDSDHEDPDATEVDDDDVGVGDDDGDDELQEENDDQENSGHNSDSVSEEI